MSDVKRELIGAALLEILIITITIVAAIMEKWGLFSALAFSSVITPLWIIAVAAVLSAAPTIAELTGGNDE